MKLIRLLRDKRGVLVERWRALVFESYPEETRLFFQREKDRFTNPVAYRLSEGLEALYDALIKDMELDQVKSLLDEIISIKAVQNFTPSQALAFIFLLKGLLREELAADLADEEVARGLLQLEAQIDGMALLAFDVYMERRQRLVDIRVAEMKRQVSGWLRKAGIGLE